MSVKPFAKALAALFGAVATWGIAALDDNAVTSPEWFSLLAALGTVLAVWGVPNTPPEVDEPPAEPVPPETFHG